MYACFGGFGALEQFGKNASKYFKSLAGINNIDNKVIYNPKYSTPHSTSKEDFMLSIKIISRLNHTIKTANIFLMPLFYLI